MAKKAAIIGLEYDIRNDRIIVTRSDGSVERVAPEQVKRRVLWDEDRRTVVTQQGLHGVVIDDG